MTDESITVQMIVFREDFSSGIQLTTDLRNMVQGEVGLIVSRMTNATSNIMYAP